MKKFFSILKRYWLLFAQKLGKVNTLILLSLVYFIIVGIMSLLVRLFRKDLLHRKIDINLASYWQTRLSSEQSLDRHKFQF
jgi:hypothetical protein